MEGRFYPWFGVAIEPVNGVLYLTGEGLQGKQTVARAEMEELSTLSPGGSCPAETIATGALPTGVAVDATSAFVAWPDTGQRSIAIADQDGWHRVTIAKNSPIVDPTQNVF